MLQPGFITLTANYMFPDGYNRQLLSTRLYVDGEVVAENKEPPFEFFAWPLENYQFSGEHLLSVEVEDILGFRSISPPVAVMITVESLYPAWLTGLLKFLTSGGWIPIAIVALGGSIAVGLRIRRRQLTAEVELQDSYPDHVDPLDQTIPGLDIIGDENQVDRVGSPTAIKSEIPPQLIWAGSGKSPLNGNSIEIREQQIVIGNDPNESDIVLPSDSISPKHAMLVRSEGGSVRLADLGSEAGTWVNYAPVSKKGVILNNNDLVQIGKLGFRYQIGGYH